MDYKIFVYNDSIYTNRLDTNMVSNSVGVYVSEELFSKVLSFQSKFSMWINHSDNVVYLPVVTLLNILDPNPPLPF